MARARAREADVGEVGVIGGLGGADIDGHEALGPFLDEDAELVVEGVDKGTPGPRPRFGLGGVEVVEVGDRLVDQAAEQAVPGPGPGPVLCGWVGPVKGVEVDTSQQRGGRLGGHEPGEDPLVDMPEGIGALGRLEPLDGTVHQREDTHVLGPPGGMHEAAPVVEAHRVEAVRQHIGGQHDDLIEEGTGRHRPPLGVLAGREHEAAQRPSRRVEHRSPWRRRSRATPGEVAGCRVLEEPRPRRVDDEAPTGEGGEALGEPRRVAAHQAVPDGIGGADHDRRRQ